MQDKHDHKWYKNNLNYYWLKDRLMGSKKIDLQKLKIYGFDTIKSVH